MHAHPAHVPLTAIFNDGERCRRQLGFRIFGKAVNLLTGLLTAAAADALGDVYKDGSRVFHGLHLLLKTLTTISAHNLALGEEELLHNFLPHFRSETYQHTANR